MTTTTRPAAAPTTPAAPEAPGPTLLDAIPAPRLDVEAGLRPRPDALDDATHDAIVARVARCYAAMIADRPAAPAAYRPAGEWSAYHERFAAFHAALAAGDVATAAPQLRRFWRNEHGGIVKEYADFAQVRDGVEPRASRFRERVARNWRIWRAITAAPTAALAMPAAGDPWGVGIEGVLVAPKATRFHALATQVAALIDDAAAPVVLEIGAGYGGMAGYLLRDRPGTTWIDLDLPETLVYAAYWLLATDPARRVHLYGEGPLPDAARWRELDAVLLPNWCLEAIPDRAAACVVNTFSLSEMTPDALATTLQGVARTCDGWFLHHNVDRRGIVNRGFGRTAASDFPIDPRRLALVATNFDLFHGHEGDYREFLYRRRGGPAT